MRRGLHRFALVTAAAAFLLVIAGGLVTSTGSGLAVPDWPLSYGTLFPPMVGGIRFEHTHRLIAATVGLLTLILTLWLLIKESRRWVRYLGIGAFGLVVLQGILGGLTVLLQLPPQVSVAHACVGQTFFATLAVLATVLSPQWANGRMAHPAAQPKSLPVMSLITTAVIFGQLLIGALMRHTGWLPKLLAAHIIGAVLVFVCIVRTSGMVMKQYRSEPLFNGPAKRLIWLFLLQVPLGITTLAQGAATVGVATAHVAVGALLLANSAVLTISIFAFLRHPFHPADPWSRPLRDYLELTKPRLTFLAVISSLIGFLLGSTGPVDWGKLLAVILGAGLTGGGAGALNQVLEWREDSRMNRTRCRPIPSGRIRPESALLFGVAISVMGLLILTLAAHPLAGNLAAATLGSYLFLYTPLKRRTALCTLVGAIPGAIPPLIGWAAARGALGLEAWVLFAILFFWQLPHFLAIAWTHREDYARAGFQMLPVLDPDGGSTGRQIALYCLALVPVSLLPAVLGSAGPVYFVAALASGLAFLGCGLSAARLRSGRAAHRLFLASILYLPVILITMTLDRTAGS